MTPEQIEALRLGFEKSMQKVSVDTSTQLGPWGEPQYIHPHVEAAWFGWKFAKADAIHSCGYFCQIPACIKVQRDELVIQVEALKVDAARMRWIALQDFNDFCFGFVVDAEHDGEYWIDVGDGPVYEKSIREAIDAAMTKEQAT